MENKGKITIGQNLKRIRKGLDIYIEPEDILNPERYEAKKRLTYILKI